MQRTRLASLAVMALALGGAVGFGVVQAGTASAAAPGIGAPGIGIAVPPSPTPPRPPTTPPPPGGRCPVPWSASTVYLGAARVAYGNHAWTAQWWTLGETPGTSAVWKDDGFCSGGTTVEPTPSVTATPSPSASTPQPTPGFCTQEPFSAATVYTQGMTVAHDGRVYRARWWTLNEVPGGAEVWLDKGPC